MTVDHSIIINKKLFHTIQANFLPTMAGDKFVHYFDAASSAGASVIKLITAVMNGPMTLKICFCAIKLTLK